MTRRELRVRPERRTEIDIERFARALISMVALQRQQADNRDAEGDAIAGIDAIASGKSDIEGTNVTTVSSATDIVVTDAEDAA